MKENYPYPQRFISISIYGVHKNGRVFYSYTSPVSGIVVNNSPKCEISVDQPTYSLFLLDFSASMNGWTISGITPRAPSEPLETMEGPQGLSIMTINRYSSPTAIYAFYIHYRNTITGEEFKADPQEGNVSPPGDTLDM